MQANLLWEIESSSIAMQVALAILLAGIVVCVWLLWRYAQRMDEVRGFLRRMATGDFRRESGIKGGGALGGLAQAAQEKTEQLQDKIRALTDERDRSTEILRSMAEGIAVVDDAEHIVFCNEAFARAWNMAAKIIEGKSVLEVIRLPEAVELVRRALQGEERLSGEISTGGTARPQSFFISVAPVRSFEKETGTPARKAANDQSGAVVVMHDITELRRLEQVRKDFVANVSHELRTPLTAIHGFAETLLAGALDDRNNNRRFVEIIRDHSARLSRLTDDLLKLSRIEAGKLEFELQPVDLREVVTLEEEAARAAAAKKGLSLSVGNFPAKLGRVRGDTSLLREVLRNLLDNAIQYTNAGGEVRVSATPNGDFAILTVEDTGIGIPTADQSRIFERFYRVDDARSRGAGGTGLGLAIAKHVIEAHGGKIWVESTVGEGSKFHFSVPLAR